MFGPDPRPSTAVAAFSLIEIMVVVGLLSVIVLGLMAMFNQTQRAFRLGMSQTDVLESGRMATELIAREFEEMTPCYCSNYSLATYGAYGAPNFYAVVTNFTIQCLPGNTPVRTNVMSDVFFIFRQNQTWTGIGYFVRTNRLDLPSMPGGVGPVGTLYRFETNNTMAQFKQSPGAMFAHFNYVLQQLELTNVSKIVDGVVHFRVRPFDPDGWLLTNNPSWYTGLRTPPCAMTNRDVMAVNVFPASGEIGGYALYSNAVPASLEVELGILEQQVYEQYNSIPSPFARWDFLTNRQARAVSHLHVFRQRIPVRNVDPAVYQ